jgi:hypothetical protein
LDQDVDPGRIADRDGTSWSADERYHDVRDPTG